MNTQNNQKVIGYYDIHPDASINFQMNRFYNWSHDPKMLSEMQDAAPKIKSYDDYIRIFLNLAEQAMAENRKLTAAFYIRGAEFYMLHEDNRKKDARERFLSIIKEYYQVDPKTRHLIPYENGKLPAYRLTPPNPKGTIILFGGFDTYIEELFEMCFNLKNSGYDLICFEGPGQGGALEDYGLHLTHEWEKPTTAVLDYFSLKDVTVLGLSLGGYFAVRAAAFDKRIKRVIADDVCYDFSEILLNKINPSIRGIFKTFVYNGGGFVINSIMNRITQKDLLMKWAIKHGMHVTGTNSPFEFIKKMLNCNSIETSHMVTQDVLLFAAQDDHYIPYKQLTDQIKALTNIRSLTTRTFTKRENAQNHCQLGNIGLANKVMLDWLDEVAENEKK